MHVARENKPLNLQTLFGPTTGYVLVITAEWKVLIWWKCSSAHAQKCDGIETSGQALLWEPRVSGPVEQTLDKSWSRRSSDVEGALQVVGWFPDTSTSRHGVSNRTMVRILHDQLLYPCSASELPLNYELRKAVLLYIHHLQPISSEKPMTLVNSARELIRIRIYLKERDLNSFLQ